MEVHFYASLERIKSIHQGHTGLVVTKESREEGLVQVSFDLEKYGITRSTGDPYSFIVEKK